MKRITYAAWAAEKLRPYSKHEQQEMRKHYWGERERVYRYDEYAAFCKARKQTPDSPPPLYWELMEEPWHKPLGLGLGALGVFAWFLTGIVTRSTGGTKDA